MADSETLRFLLADDSEAIRSQVSAQLAADGHEVLGQAGNGAQAVSMAKELQPDAILLDIEMPEMNGNEALGQIREALPNVAILMMTSRAERDLVMECLKKGADGYVLKGPTSHVGLSQRFAAAIAKRAAASA